MNTIILAIVLGCLGSTGLFSLLQFILTRCFTKKDNENENTKALIKLSNRANKGELNDSRIQLLILINHYPDNHYAILKEAEHYFVELHGDS